MFRQHAPQPRLPAPPTAYPTGLQPVASEDLTSNRQLHRRISRTDLDFEQALMAEGTVMLREGLDVNSLGVDTSPSPLNRSFASPSSTLRGTPRAPQPATPIVIPPTPSASASKPRAPSPSTLSHDVFYDPDDSERQTNRRSMYRSPGTSSSPDLATLLRKAKERGGVVATSNHPQKKETRRDSPPPLPSHNERQTNGTRQRSSTAAYSQSNNTFGGTVSAGSSPMPKVKHNGTRGAYGDPNEEWALASPLPPKENGHAKPKQSVRAKTSAFLGKMLGQSAGRERSATFGQSSSQNASGSATIFNAFTPPVPPIPSEYKTSPVVPTGSPIADVFSPNLRSPLPSKPLPPLIGSPTVREGVDDERSMIFVDKAPLPPLPQTPEPKPEVSTATIQAKRRSMSVSDVDIKKVLDSNAVSPLPLPKTPEAIRKLVTPRHEGDTLKSILDDFKGELFATDTAYGSLDLRDPSTPARRAAFLSKADSVTSSPSSHEGDGEGSESKRSSMPASIMPRLTLQLPTQGEGLDEEANTPIVPPRSSSLQSPSRSSARPSSIGAVRVPNTRPGANPLRSRSGPAAGLQPQGSRETGRHRVLHHASGSNSEPSLVRAIEDARASSSPRAGSHQDLTVNDLTPTRFPSTTTSPLETEEIDIESRGKDLATRCWNEDEEFLAKEKIAEWLGGNGQINKLALRHYIDFFDFSGLRLDIAFRRLCAKLYVKGETQQVDRILEQFSRRYFECNPSGLYTTANIVHSVAYSLLLLNTDLHVAEISARMSRSQFVRNTMTAIQMQLQPTPSAQVSTTDLTYDDCGSSIRGAGSDSTEMNHHRTKRSDSITSWNSVNPREIALASSGINHPSPELHHPNGSTPSVQIPADHRFSAPNAVYGRVWENDMESLLKEMYNAIKSQQILQPLNTSATRSSMSGLSPGGTMIRNRSLRSPAPDRLTTLKRGSIRGLQSIMGAQNSISPYSSNSSIDGRVSPSPSFATSTHEALYGSSSSFLNPTLGFASNLSHTIIREAQEDDDRSVRSDDSNSTSISITDEELALLGAPWAKEGMLCRKQYWESSGKRARDKAWLDVFVVIQKGELNMFIFGEGGGSGSGTFGGGNWLANARSVGTVHLSHSLAHSLPSPGYNRQRPYCMVLTLANGGVYFFQAGTEELVNEWVSTCNYWAARTSKEPLAGGVSNMEYGWNRVADPYSGTASQSDAESFKEIDYTDNQSTRSGKSGRSKYGWRDNGATVRGHSPWADRVVINDWKPPLPPTVSSLHDEETQLDALRKHVASMKTDLERHNEFRQPMAALYQPRTNNAMKAQSNWEKKSQYLLTEIVKYDSYIDSLQAAMSLRLKKRGEKALERALNGAPTDEPSSNNKGKWKGPEEETIHEEAEPTTPGAGKGFGPLSHRREMAHIGGDDGDE